MNGQTISHYRVTAKLGQGGMGAVYRATDTKLDREVAIKVLPESFAQDRERLARFEREAKVLGSLNHPNIAGIFGLEQTGNSHALVLELVEGEDLSERLTRGPLPVEEALDTDVEWGRECFFRSRFWPGRRNGRLAPGQRTESPLPGNSRIPSIQ